MKKLRKSLLSSLKDSLLTYIKLPFNDFFTVYNHFSDPDKRKRILHNIWRFSSTLYRRITTEGVLKESSSLTYITLLGFIPFITFLVMIVPTLPFLDFKSRLNEVLVKIFMPGSAEAVSRFIGELVQQRTGFNIFSFILLMITSYSLFRVIRNTFDRILGTEFYTTPDFLGQIIKFFGTLILGMVIMVMLFSASSMPIISRLLKYSFLMQLGLNIIPFILQFMALIFLYLLLPSIKVKRGALFRGAFWTTVIWTIVKSWFDWYIYNLTNVQAVYGYLAVLPITLMWIYLNWVIIIGGIVLISVIDQKDHLQISKAIPKQVVRITMEMSSNNKLNKRLEAYFTKHDLKEFINDIDEEGEQ